MEIRADQVNLVAFVVGTDRAVTPLLLNTHLDTVPPGDPALWTACGGNPFEASINGLRNFSRTITGQAIFGNCRM